MLFFSSPLEQFEIIPFLSFSIAGKLFSFTNQTYFLALLFSLMFLTYYLAFSEQRLVPLRLQVICEALITFTSNLVTQNVGRHAIVYFPLIFMVFNFVMFANMVGMVPYSFTVTSHIFVTFFLALSLFIGINIQGIRKHGLNFLELFMPPGAPLVMAPLFVAIELISYNARVFSLSIRLFANVTSGHALLKILAGFAWTMLFSSLILKLAAAIPLAIIIAITFLEAAIGLMQAYVFAILTCLYLNDALSLAH